MASVWGRCAVALSVGTEGMIVVPEVIVLMTTKLIESEIDAITQGIAFLIESIVGDTIKSNDDNWSVRAPIRKSTIQYR